MTTALATGRPLRPEHLADLRGSGLSDATIGASGFYSADADEVAAILGFAMGPGLVFPYGNDPATFKRIKPDRRYKDGPKYLSPRGSGNRLYLPAMLDRTILVDASRPLYVTEGEKKAVKAVQEGLACIALAGVWSWRGTTESGEKGAIPDLDEIEWHGRRAYIVFDSDLVKNEQVADAERALADELARRGAEVFGVRLPCGTNVAKVGLDDYLILYDMTAFCALPTVHLAAPTMGAYFISGGRLCRWTKIGSEPLASFTARVVEEITLDDGLEPIKHFLIEGHRDDGVQLPVAVPAARFGGMEWVAASWGVRAVVHAGMGTRDHLRAAIQTFSHGVTQRRIYAHTGWRLIDGGWRFLTAAGAVGRADVEVELPAGLQGYRLPVKSNNVRESVRATLDLRQPRPRHRHRPTRSPQCFGRR